MSTVSQVTPAPAPAVDSERKTMLLRRVARRNTLLALVSDPVVFTVIGINTVALVALGFFRSDFLHHTATPLERTVWWVDYACTAFFCVEALLKIGLRGFAMYWRSRWNRFDLFVIAVSSPALLTPWVAGLDGASVLLILRVGRLVRLVKLARFIPDGQRMWDGIVRALRASVGLFGGLLLMNLVLALIAATLFGSLDSDTARKAFENPISSFYTVFKVFTVEGWFDLPEQIAAETQQPGWGTAVRVYFMIAVLIGGFLGLSIVNAVFVDEMVKDNNQELEKEIDRLRRQFELSVERLIEDQNRMLEVASAERLQLKMMLDQLQNCVNRALPPGKPGGTDEGTGT